MYNFERNEDRTIAFLKWIFKFKNLRVIFVFRRGSIETRSQENVLHEFYANKSRTGELKKSELYIEEMLQDNITGEL